MSLRFFTGTRTGEIQSRLVSDVGGVQGVLSDTLANLLCLCERCHHQVHEGTIRLQIAGVSGHLDQIAQRAMQGKTYLYATLGRAIPLSTVFGFETAAYRKHLGLPKTHIIDACCIATLATGEGLPIQEISVYRIDYR